MTTEQITFIIHEHIADWKILNIDIQINEDNQQLDLLTITMKPEQHTTFIAIGHIMEELDNLTMDDEYGDLTSLDLSWTSFHEIGDDLTDQFIIKTNIDS